MLKVEPQGRTGNQIFQIIKIAAESYRTKIPFLIQNFPWRKSFHYLNNDHIYFDMQKEDFLASKFDIPIVIRQIEESNPDKGHSLTPDPNPKRINHYFGYFQSEINFDFCSDAIRELFTPIDDTAFKEETCGIHIRRGDYGQCEVFPILPLNYYTQALDLIPSTVKRFIILSEDIKWSSENLGPEIRKRFPDAKVLYEQNIYPNSTPEQLLIEYSKCDHHIVANSSLSWLGAWLGHKDGQYIFPRTWFGGDRCGGFVPSRYPKNATII